MQVDNISDELAETYWVTLLESSANFISAGLADAVICGRSWAEMKASGDKKQNKNATLEASVAKITAG